MDEYNNITLVELRDKCKGYKWYNKNLSKLDLYKHLYPEKSIDVVNEKFLRSQNTKDLRRLLEKYSVPITTKKTETRDRKMNKDECISATLSNRLFGDFEISPKSLKPPRIDKETMEKLTQELEKRLKEKKAGSCEEVVST